MYKIDAKFMIDRTYVHQHFQHFNHNQELPKRIKSHENDNNHIQLMYKKTTYSTIQSSYHENNNNNRVLCL